MSYAKIRERQFMSFLMVGVVKKKHQRSEKKNKNKKNKYFAIIWKKQGGFDYFKTKTDSWQNVKEIDFLTEIH